MKPQIIPENALESWVGYLQRQGKSDHTIAAYRRAVEHFTTWNQSVYQAPLEVSAVIPRDVRDWKAWQQAVEKTAPATVNQRLVGVSRFFAWATSEGLAREDPTAGIATLRLPPRQPKGIPEADLRQMLRKAKDEPRDSAIIELLAGTGLRVGELLALQVGDVVLSERSGRVIVRQAKHGTYREVPLTADVRKALEAHLAVHPDKDDPDAPLWVGTRGPLIHRTSVARILNTYALAAGIGEINPHALRHTFATRYLKANPGDLRGLARLLGHTSLSTVMIYTEPDMDDLAERMERMEQGG
jgi:site-specific recombinase XerC